MQKSNSKPCEEAIGEFDSFGAEILVRLLQVLQMCAFCGGQSLGRLGESPLFRDLCPIGLALCL